MDLDGAKQIYRVHGWSYNAHDDPLFETGLRTALDFFDRAKVRATLFVIAEDLDNPRKRELLKDAVAKGHEIASHSLLHRKLTTLSHDEKRCEIFESRERIATVLGVEVCGFRAPGFEIDRESLELVAAAGYVYDSSLFPDAKCARKVGVPHVSDGPHCPLQHRSLLELPLPSPAPFPVPFHPCYSLVLGVWYFRTCLRKFRRTSAPLILLFHLTDLADPLPNDRLPNLNARLYTLSHLNREKKRRQCEYMLERVKHGYQLVDTTTLLTRHAK
jgi:hypothetical protein